MEKTVTKTADKANFDNVDKYTKLNSSRNVRRAASLRPKACPDRDVAILTLN